MSKTNSSYSVTELYPLYILKTSMRSCLFRRSSNFHNFKHFNRSSYILSLIRLKSVSRFCPVVLHSQVLRRRRVDNARSEEAFEKNIYMAKPHACHTNDIIGMASAIPAHCVPAPLRLLVRVCRSLDDRLSIYIHIPLPIILTYQFHHRSRR